MHPAPEVTEQGTLLASVSRILPGSNSAVIGYAIWLRQIGYATIITHAFLSYVLSLICEAVLCLELVFAELGQVLYK